MKKIPVGVTPEIYEKFKALCHEKGVTMAEVGREMVEAFCDDTGVST